MTNKMVQAASPPALAKNARTGHPQFWNGKENPKGGPPAPGAGAQTVDPTNVQINSLGLYMTAANGGIRLPNGFTCNLGSVTNVRAFILLHELGHQLSGNTGFTPDVDAATNSAHSMRIIKACFQCGN